MFSKTFMVSATENPFTRSIAVRILIFLAALWGACLSSPLRAQDGPVEVQLKDRQGNPIGMAHISRHKSGVQIEMNASGLSKGKHGLHIHGKGVCDPPDFKSAGPHFSPENRSHGFLDEEGPHAGDLPMLDAGADGEVKNYSYTTTRVKLEPGSLLDADGSSLIVHAKPDDYLTDAGGGTGDRIACGVISPPKR